MALRSAPPASGPADVETAPAPTTNPDTAFKQQRLKAYSPTLTPVFVTFLFLAVGVPFVLMGGSLLAGPLDTGLPPFDLALLDEIPVDAPQPRLASRLSASPNPFNPRVEIRLEPAALVLDLEILDLRGRRVARLSGARDGAGTSWIWDGTNARGESVASGAYFARAIGIDVPPIKLTLVR